MTTPGEIPASYTSIPDALDATRVAPGAHEPTPEALQEKIAFGAAIIPKAVLESAPGVPERVRPSEDSCITDAENGVFAVADGVGGEAAGDKTSGLAVTTFNSEVSRVRPLLSRYADNPAKIQEILADCITRTDRAIASAKAGLNSEFQIPADFIEEGKIRGSATTLVAAVLLDNKKVAFVNIGDSRALIRRHSSPDTLEPVTRDQSEINLVFNSLNGRTLDIPSGRTRREDPSYNARYLQDKLAFYNEELPKRNLTMADFADEITIVDMEEGDEILLCSDGLTGDQKKEKIWPSSLARVMTEHQDNPQGAAVALVSLPEKLQARGDYPYPGLTREAKEKYEQAMRGYPERVRRYEEAVRTGRTWIVDEHGQSRQMLRPVKPIKPAFKPKIDDRTAVVVPYRNWTWERKAVTPKQSMAELLNTLPAGERALVEPLANRSFEGTQVGALLHELDAEGGRNFLATYSSNAVRVIVELASEQHKTGNITAPSLVDRALIRSITNVLAGQSEQEQVRDVTALALAIRCLTNATHLRERDWHPRNDPNFVPRLTSLLAIAELQQPPKEEGKS